MGVYLCHGFRWHRDAIRFFVIIEDIDDAAPSWVVAPQSSTALVTHFYDIFDFLPYRDGRSGPPPLPQQGPPGAQDRQDEPAKAWEHHPHTPAAPDERGKSPSREPVAAQDPPVPTQPPPGPPSEEELSAARYWSAVALLEEFDPTNLSVASGPWAYVADHVVRVDTSVSIVEEMLRYEALEKSRSSRAMSGPSDETGQKLDTAAKETAAAGWLERLRDKLQTNERIRWYVVVCDDEDRVVDPPPAHLTEDEERTIGYTSEDHEPPLATAEDAVEGDDDGGRKAGGFRFPELLLHHHQHKPPAGKPKKKDWNVVLKQAPAFLKQAPLADEPPPSPLEVAPESTAPVDTTSARKRESRRSGLRRLFSRRFRDS